MSRPQRVLEPNLCHQITVRYINAPPKITEIRRGYFYACSNYGIYHRLSEDDLTQWHPAFLSLGQNLDTCQQRYQRFCQRYAPKKTGGLVLEEAACSRTACRKTPVGLFPDKTSC